MTNVYCSAAMGIATEFRSDGRRRVGVGLERTSRQACNATIRAGFQSSHWSKSGPASPPSVGWTDPGKGTRTGPDDSGEAGLAPPPGLPITRKVGVGVLVAAIIAGMLVLMGIVNDIEDGPHDLNETSQK